ncbi:hypothetical protein Dsin_011725 [Dipteronia sinensis]|uniref:DUF4283 domain-containing protein n=1 Tax=Dipteronia sinensis TaxID=43782 RepID=A0AAE0AHN2_9ROSI|nr:hypothetical protein Dsin_011725 [Dipteronia sinensis]
MRSAGDRFRKEDLAGKESKQNRTYKEALDRDARNCTQQEESKNEKLASLFISPDCIEGEWLNKCAVGILHSFSSVSTVNDRLSSRGFAFSANYLGAKHVLWQFDSEYENEGFIKNRFFWDDRFISMNNWSESFNPSQRLVWINCVGIPLKLSNNHFLMKLSPKVGEPLWINEDTTLKRRLDRAKILVSVHKDHLIPTNVKVVVGKGSFLVNIKEEKDPTIWCWADKHLSLKKNSCPDILNLILDKEGCVDQERAGVGEPSFFDDALAGEKIRSQKQLNRAKQRSHSSSKDDSSE